MVVCINFLTLLKSHLLTSVYFATDLNYLKQTQISFCTCL